MPRRRVRAVAEEFPAEAERFPVTVRGLNRATEIAANYLMNYGPHPAAWVSDTQLAARLSETASAAIWLDPSEPKRIYMVKVTPSLREAMAYKLKLEYGEGIEGWTFRVTCGPNSRCVREQGARDGCDIDMGGEPGEVVYSTSWCIY